MTFGRGLRELLLIEPKELFRRYFINTVFDSTFVVMGILAATALVPEANPEVAIEALFAACLAIAVSTGVSVHEAESIEDEIRINQLERALLSPLRDTEVGKRMRASRFALAAVNFSAPLVVGALTGTPLLLHQAGVIPDFAAAALASSVISLGIIFSAGYYLGTLTRRPWLRAVRMSAFALLTFLILILLDRLL